MKYKICLTMFAVALLVAAVTLNSYNIAPVNTKTVSVNTTKTTVSTTSIKKTNTENEKKEEIRGCFALPLFMNISNIIDNEEYDKALQKWAGNYNWKLIYRASEHGYTAKSFHECCDDVKGPTLVVIKSSGGWIFGGYTTQSWSIWSIYYDLIY